MTTLRIMGAVRDLGEVWDESWHRAAMSDLRDAANAVDSWQPLYIIDGRVLTPEYIAAYREYSFGRDLRDRLDVTGVTTNEIVKVQRVIRSGPENLQESLSSEASVPMAVSAGVITRLKASSPKEMAIEIVKAHVAKLSANRGADFVSDAIESYFLASRSEDESLWKERFLESLSKSFGSSPGVGSSAFDDHSGSNDRIADTVRAATAEVLDDLEPDDEMEVTGP